MSNLLMTLIEQNIESNCWSPATKLASTPTDLRTAMSNRNQRARPLTARPIENRDGISSWKRALDLTCIVVASPVLLVVMGLIAAFIKLVSRGPVLFKQERVGYQGRRFTCLKFRSMRPDADAGVHQDHLRDLMHSDVPMTKMDHHGDRRLIPLGALLRATGLDELPQLLNVLRGEMSLVGPRPCIAYEYDHYLPWQKERFNTLPGLTGLWQVNGKNRTTFTQMINHDIDYVRRQSPWLDLIILARTFVVPVTQVRDLYFAHANGHHRPAHRRHLKRQPAPATRPTL
jgi:exopolysaccharide production protein ExoY